VGTDLRISFDPVIFSRSPVPSVRLYQWDWYRSRVSGPPVPDFPKRGHPGYHRALSFPAPSRAYFYPLADSTGQITRWPHVCFPPNWWTRRVTLLPAERRSPVRSRLHIWTRGSMMSHRRQTIIGGDTRSPALGTMVLFPQLWEEDFFSRDETAWAPSKRAAPRLTSTVRV